MKWSFVDKLFMAPCAVILYSATGSLAFTKELGLELEGPSYPAVGGNEGMRANNSHRAQGYYQIIAEISKKCLK